MLGDGEAFPVLADSRARKHAPRFVGERANATMDPETIRMINLLECLSEDHPVRLPSPFPPESR